MNTQEICTALANPAMEARIAEGFAQWPDADPKVVERTLKWILALRNDLVALLAEIEDDAEVNTTLAIHYIELKSRWIALNTKVNYATFRTGKCNQEDAFRGSATSILLHYIEQMLEPSDIEQITTFLAQPIRQAA